MAAQSTAQSSQAPVVAFVTGTVLNLASSSGQVVQKIDLGHPVYNFALSRDRKLLVTVALETGTGGNLGLLNLQTRTQTRLTNKNLYFKTKELDKGETEVYDDPQFSPDGRSLAFAIHTDNPGDGNDAINDSGPLAVMNLQTHQVRVLKATENINGEGLCFANGPMWSPDGKWILFNCEDGAFITDAQGITLHDLKLGTDQNAATSAVSWVGNGCVLYVQSHMNASELDQERDGIRLFNLRTSKSQLSTVLPALPKQSLAGLKESSEEAAIMQSGSGVAIEVRGRVWAFPSIKLDFNGYTPSIAPAAHILGGWHPSTIPHGCE